MCSRLDVDWQYEESPQADNKIKKGHACFFFQETTQTYSCVHFNTITRSLSKVVTLKRVHDVPTVEIGQSRFYFDLI